MAIIAATPLGTAKALLNDPSGYIYPDDKMLPLLQKAYGELQTKMMLNGLPVLREQTTATPVAAGTVLLGDGSGLPGDFVYPLHLAERALNSTLLYEDMDELDWEPTLQQDTRLRYWNWREEEIKFLGATTNREVRIRYMKGLTRITATTTPIAVNNSEAFLASRCAAIAAVLIGSNPTKGQALGEDAQVMLDDLLGVLVKRQQGLGVRRRVNRYRR